MFIIGLIHRVHTIKKNA